MPIRAAKQLTFAPHGLSDAFDESDAFPGACQSLVNLIFDSSNPDQVIARPGVGAPVTSFAGFTDPTFVSLQVTIGNYIYGMVASARFPEYDEPFVWDIVNAQFITITGVTSANLPRSLSTAGAWIPPCLAAIDQHLIITHVGFNGVGSNFVGSLNIATLTAPVWSSFNTATNLLPSVPTSVANFNNRAYYACGNVDYFSDPLVPTTMTNSTQNVTIGDTTPIVAQSGLPFTAVSAGIVSALLILKANQIWIVTGDTATSNLALNFISLTVGTSSPRSVIQTPIGVIFIGQDAPYVITSMGVVMELKHPSMGAADVRAPFQNATVPSRIAAAYAGNIYRVCLATILTGNIVTNDYWFDLRRMRWTGPHTFSYDCASQYNDEFYLSGIGTGAALYLSIADDTTLNTLYNDNGTQISSNLLTTFLADGGAMEFKQTVESTLDVTSGGISVGFAMTALDDLGNTLATATVQTAAQGAVWGNFTWDDGTVWATSTYNPRRYDVYWTNPIVWDRMAINITASSSSDLSIGKFKAGFQTCGYTLRQPPIIN